MGAGGGGGVGEDVLGDFPSRLAGGGGDLGVTSPFPSPPTPTLPPPRHPTALLQLHLKMNCHHFHVVPLTRPRRGRTAPHPVIETLKSGTVTQGPFEITPSPSTTIATEYPPPPVLKLCVTIFYPSL